MEGTGTGATAMLVGTPGDAGERPDAATVTLAREEIEQALASDAPLDLILSVQPAGGEPQDVRVGWKRSDLESVLAGVDAGPITFSFDRAELHRALEHPDFEGHGIRELVLLVAAASSSAALAASTASGQIMEATGGGGTSVAAAVQPGDAGTIPYLSQGTGVDQSLFQGEPTAQPGDPGTIPYLSQGTGVDQSQFQGEPTAQPADPGTIPYLSQGTGVDQSQFQGGASPSGDTVAPAIHDEASAVERGIGVGVPGSDEAGATARGLDPAIATAMEAATARDLAEAAGPAVDEAGAATRGIGVSVPGADEAGLDARGVHVAAVHDEGTLVTRGIETPAAPVDSGTGFEMPSIDSGAAAAIGAAAGAGLLILGAAFATRRRETPV